MKHVLLITNKWQGHDVLDRDIEIMWAKIRDLAQQGWKIFKEMECVADKDGKPYYCLYAIMDTEEGKVLTL
jgi:hypothetical protein